MSEYERPTAASDDEQSPAPTLTASAHAPGSGLTEEPASQPGEPPGPPAADAEPTDEQSGPPTAVEAPADEAITAAERVARSDPAGTTTSDSAGTTTSGRSALLRPRNLALISIAVVALVLAAIFVPIASEMWGRDNVRLVTPSRVAGLVLDDSQGAHDTIDYLRTAVQTGVSLEKSTGAVYADEAGQSRSVLFVGGTGAVGSPEDALTKTFRLISDDTGGVESVHTLPPGPLGGVMRCGSTRTDGGSMAVCGWADHRSLGIAMFPNRPVDQSAELLRTMRKAMQNG
jgi:hypothetical protein